MIMSINLMSFSHCPYLSKPSPKLIFIIFGILFILAPLHSQSLRETEAFSFIVEMLQSSDGYMDEAEKEIEVFRAKYPDSPYIQYLDYLSAILLSKKEILKKVVCSIKN